MGAIDLERQATENTGQTASAAIFNRTQSDRSISLHTSYLLVHRYQDPHRRHGQNTRSLRPHRRLALAPHHRRHQPWQPRRPHDGDARARPHPHRVPRLQDVPELRARRGAVQRAWVARGVAGAGAAGIGDVQRRRVRPQPGQEELAARRGDPQAGGGEAARGKACRAAEAAEPASGEGDEGGEYQPACIHVY